MASKKLWNVLAVNGSKNDLWLTADKEVLPLTGQKPRVTMEIPKEAKSFLYFKIVFYEHRKSHLVKDGLILFWV
jgi:hypothetical protein